MDLTDIDIYFSLKGFQLKEVNFIIIYLIIYTEKFSYQTA